MLIPLIAATAETSGSKAGALGVLARAGFRVPDGFIVPPSVAPDTDATHAADLSKALRALGSASLAVRSSASDEDSPLGSAAGQYETVLGVRGQEAVLAAISRCRRSLWSLPATTYRDDLAGARPGDAPFMAVIVQTLVDADVAGVMFTSDGGRSTRTESSWGLGMSVAGGTVTPDTYTVAADGAVRSLTATKTSRFDRRGTHIIRSAVPRETASHPTLDDATARRLASLGYEIAALMGAPQDIEWAIADGVIWILQSRPITVSPPRLGAAQHASASPWTLRGMPSSPGSATGTARIVRSPAGFAAVQHGDILICPHTDPAWTPLLRIVAGVVTETGGVLAHAAIVAREQRIPAILGVAAATTLIPDGALIHLEADTGTITRRSPATTLSTQ